MTEMLISSPRVHADVKDGELVLQILNKNWGGGGGKEEQNIKIREIIWLFQHVAEQGFPLLFICSASPILQVMLAQVDTGGERLEEIMVKTKSDWLQYREGTDRNLLSFPCLERVCLIQMKTPLTWKKSSSSKCFVWCLWWVLFRWQSILENASVVCLDQEWHYTTLSLAVLVLRWKPKLKGKDCKINEKVSYLTERKY